MIDAHRVTLSAPDDFEGWRDSARDLAEAGVPASAVVWQVEGDDADLFGSEMNIASKLGEDVAARGEILLSSGARERIAAEFEATEIPVQLSGLALKVYRCT